MSGEFVGHVDKVNTNESFLASFKDDSAVIGILARKYYSDIPRIEVALFEVDNLDIVITNNYYK